MFDKPDYLSVEYAENIIIDFPHFLPFKTKREAQRIMIRLYKVLSHYEEHYSVGEFVLNDTPHILREQDKLVIQDWCVCAIGALAKASAQRGLSMRIAPILFHLVDLHATKRHIVAYLYRCIAETATTNGDLKIGIDYGINAFNIYIKSDDSLNAGICAYIVATAFRGNFYLGNNIAIHDAMQWIEISAREYAKTTTSRQHVLMMCERGVITMAMGKYQKAIEGLLLAYHEAIQINMKRHYPTILMLVGNCYTFLQRYAQAEKNYLKSLDHYQQPKDNPRILHLYQYLAWNSLYAGDYHKSLAYCKKADKTLSEIKNVNNIILGVMRIISDIRKEADSALQKATLSSHTDKPLID